VLFHGPPRFLAECRKRRLNQGSFVSAVCLLVYMHLYSSETLIEMNNDNKFKQQKNIFFKKLCGISAVIYKAATAGGIFNIKPLNTI